MDSYSLSYHLINQLSWAARTWLRGLHFAYLPFFAGQAKYPTNRVNVFLFIRFCDSYSLLLPHLVIQPEWISLNRNKWNLEWFWIVGHFLQCLPRFGHNIIHLANSESERYFVTHFSSSKLQLHMNHWKGSRISTSCGPTTSSTIEVLQFESTVSHWSTIWHSICLIIF